jgi:predicted outer membrane repeat protein
MRLVPPVHLALGASTLLLAALYGAHRAAEGASGLFATAEAAETGDECSAPRETVEVVIGVGDGLVERVNDELDDFDHNRIDLTIVLPEDWTPNAADRLLDCYPIPSAMTVRVRVEGRDFGETHVDPENVELMGLRLMADEDGCAVGEASFQDIDVVGVCVAASGTQSAQFVVNDDWTVTLNDVSLSGDAASSGASANYGLYATSGTITATDLNVSGFSSSFGVKLADAAVTFTQTGGAYTKNTGGALGVYGATVTLTEVDFGGGGVATGRAIYAYGGTLTLNDVDFLNSTILDSGGSIYADGSTLTLTGGSFNLSSASGDGGAIYATGGSGLTLSDLSFDVTTSSGDGGAIYADGSKLNLAGVSFGGSTASLNGGAIYTLGSTLTITDGSFEDNRAGVDGGSIYASGGNLTLSGVSFLNDYAPQHGGAIGLDFVSNFTGCGLSFAGSEAEAYGGAINAHHSRVTLNAGADGACGANQFYQVSAPTGAAMSLSQEGNGDLIYAILSSLELTQIDGDTTISSSLSGSLTLEDLSTPGGLGAAGLLHTDGSSNPKIGPVTATRLHIRGDGEELPDRGSLISVENTSLTLTESSFCGVYAGDDNAPMIAIYDANGTSVLQRNTIWGGWSEVEGSALVTAKDLRTSTKYTYELKLIDNTLIGSGAERGVTTDESIRFWGVNNLLNNLAVGQSLGGEVVRLSHNLYGVSVLEPLDMNGEEVAVHELVGVQPKLFTRPARGCDQLPLLRPTSPAIGAGPGADDSELGELNEVLSDNGLEYSSLDDIGAQPIAYTERDQDGDGFADNVDCAALDPEVNPGEDEIPENGLDDDCDPNTPDVVPADQDGDGVADVDDCAPTDPSLSERCEGAVFEYSGGRAGCATAPTPLGLVGVLVALALTRRRESRFSPL